MLIIGENYFISDTGNIRKALVDIIVLIFYGKYLKKNYVYNIMNKLDELLEVKERIIRKLEISTDRKEIDLLNNHYIIIMSMIFQERIKK